MLETSVSSWYARWKAAKQAPAPPEPPGSPDEAEVAQADSQAEAVAKWLMSDAPANSGA